MRQSRRRKKQAAQLVCGYRPHSACFALSLDQFYQRPYAIRNKFHTPVDTQVRPIAGAYLIPADNLAISDAGYNLDNMTVITVFFDIRLYRDAEKQWGCVETGLT
jgi:hypothetical protein